MSEVLLKASGLEKSYTQGGKTLHILRGLSLELKPKDFVALQGASGSGKSTLLHVLGLLDTVEKGAVLIEGREAGQMSEAERARLRLEKIGFVFQFHHLIPELTAVENVCLPASMARREASEEAEQLLEWVGLKDRMNSLPWQLSGGEQQRVALARALINKPQLLLTDEVTGNLDRPRALEMIELLKGLHAKREMAILSVTHDVEIASEYTQKWHLEEGQIREE